MHNSLNPARIFSLLCAISLLLSLPTSAFAQTMEQIEQYRQQQATGGTAMNQAAVRAMQLNTTRTLPSTSAVAGSMSQFQTSPRTGLSLPGEPTIKDVYPNQPALSNPPFAANLFIGGFESERTDGLNDNYRVAAGDKIALYLWGAVNYADVATVDNQGNIFVPNVGPISLMNTPASAVNNVVTSRIKQVYTNDVNVYVNLLTATPVSVYLAGPVLRPGQYAGMASDSVLYFLKRAGGIDFRRGSFRRIDVMRDEQVYASVDLYDFAVNGVMPNISFKDGDVILVHPIGDTVTVETGARNSFMFEFNADELMGENLLRYARPDNTISHVSLSGIREGNQYAGYVDIAEFNNVKLNAGDIIHFTSDREQQVYRINVGGEFVGPSQYMVAKGARLHSVLALVAADETLSDIKNIYLLRKSVAEKQKEIINQALDRLERSIYTAPVSSTGEGAIRAQEAQLVTDFISRARAVEPIGKVLVSDGGNVANILLEPEDTIFIPKYSELVHIGGEVMLPQSVVHNPEATIEDYVAWAGGFSERANDDNIMVISSNGSVTFSALNGGLFADDFVINPGDQVVVLPRIDSKSMQAIKDITQIIYQIAVAANVVLN